MRVVEAQTSPVSNYTGSEHRGCLESNKRVAGDSVHCFLAFDISFAVE